MNLIQWASSFIPTKLPQGLTEFNEWSDSILDFYKMPNNDSTKFALAAQILHLKADDGYKPKRYFGKSLIKGAASQVAGAVMQECKNRQKALADQQAVEQKQAEENKALQVEATPPAAAVDVG